MDATQVDQVRRFNRLVTQRVGALDDHFLGRDRALGASRLLFEIGNEGADLRALRRRLGLDAGYVSRLAKGLVREGLIRLVPGEGDQRVRAARLTARGRRELDELNARSDDVAEALLEAVPARQREQLVTAMGDVRRILRAAGLTVERVTPASAAARGCVAQYFAELDRRFPGGFDPGASLPADERDLVPPRGSFLVGWIDGEAVASGCLKTVAPGICSLKRMWVADTARGLGLGRRMLDALEHEARALGFRTVRLETNRSLTEAIALYRSSGYREVKRFNEDPYADFWFEKRLTRRNGTPPATSHRRAARPLR